MVKAVDIESLPQRFFVLLKDPSIDAPWFLFQLFFIQITFFICCAISNKLKRSICHYLIMLGSVPMIIFILYLKHIILGAGYIWISPGYLLMFIMGHVIQSNVLIIKRSQTIIPLSFIAFVLTFPLFDIHMNNSIKLELIKTLTTLSFSIFAFFLVRNIYFSLHNKITKNLNFIGTNTLEIYLTHISVICLFPTQWIETGAMNAIPLFISVLLVSIPVCYISILISNVIKTIPGLSYVFYGKPQLFKISETKE